MKKILSFDIDQTLNIAKTPIPDEIAQLLINCLDYFEICPISGQKFDQFLIQIVNPMLKNGVTTEQLTHLHLFVAQGTQYYRYTSTQPNEHPTPSATTATKSSDNPSYDEQCWHKVYDFPFSDKQVSEISHALETAAKELGYWEVDKLKEGDKIIENRHTLVAYSALGQKAETEAKYAWDPDHKKREKIVKRAKEIAPNYSYSIGGTTTIDVVPEGVDKSFGMTHLMEELNVEKSNILYFGDMTQPGGNDYPVVEMGIETISVRSHEDTAYALRGILGVLDKKS
ncbi:HAD-IIB family hydrolase [Candidatus Saccharibacteria bacterium]|nr:HAD-IIB family hydrolase [Candidatus Saccharibacteria bacterium]